ncbi:adhesive plaque matrix protein [Plakobranchus ocellatus]|uniref:Adhesive plaque matrix protein n=1 Tax=Plakobranchus ocellatus TaxID=259542 RepID=A0AAV4B529_9GAST|nr:adhesive plaque matrix protein [Plakobranchus ocellatus]
MSFYRNSPKLTETLRNSPKLTETHQRNSPKLSETLRNSPKLTKTLRNSPPKLAKTLLNSPKLSKTLRNSTKLSNISQNSDTNDEEVRDGCNVADRQPLLSNDFMNLERLILCLAENENTYVYKELPEGKNVRLKPRCMQEIKHGVLIKIPAEIYDQTTDGNRLTDGVRNKRQIINAKSRVQQQPGAAGDVVHKKLC